jgi:hypothetical protein
MVPGVNNCTAVITRRLKDAIVVALSLLLTTFCSFKGFAGTPGPLTLAWDSSTDPSVVGYRLYEGIASLTYTNVLDVGSNLMASVSGLVPDETYYFAVTAYDATGLESPFSGEISYTIPSSSPPPPPLAPLTIVQNNLNQAVLSGTGAAGDVYDVCATLDFTIWLVIGSVTVDATGLFQFTDASSLAVPWRFYRLRQHTTQPAVVPNLLGPSN